MRGVEGKINAVRHCRENGLPYLGICLGFQVAVIEYARNVLGIEDAHSSEFSPSCTAVISELPEQKKIEGLGGSMRLGAQDVAIEPGSLAHHLYGSTTIRERFRHRYEVDPANIDRLTEAGLEFSGHHPEFSIMQILELPRERPEGDDRPTHPYFIGMQYHPELTSRPLRPQPTFMGLIAASLAIRHGEASLGANARWLRPVGSNSTQPA